MKYKLLVRVIFLTLIMAFYGCSSPEPLNSSELVTETVQTTIITVTPTSLLETPVSSPTATRAPTIASTPTATTFPLLSTPTPIPPLAPEKAKTLILDLLKNPRDCVLPCLWGLTPGKTDINTLGQFISQFGEDRTLVDTQIGTFASKNGGNISLTYVKDNTYVVVMLGYVRNGPVLEWLTMSSYAMENLGPNPDNQLPNLAPIYGNKTFNQELSNYLLPAILSKYGQPSQVLLATWPDDPDHSEVKWYPFSLVLLYPDQGIFVEYISPREIRGNHFMGCPYKSQIHLGVWAPEIDPTMKEIAKAGSVINELNTDYFKPVEEASSITLEEFYTIYKDPENTSCLETPKDLWKPY